MNGVDYTKQLAKERDFYQESLKKTKEASDKRIADIDARAEHVTEQQRSNFIEDRAELEKNYQENIERINEKTRQALENKQAHYQKRLSEERDNFTKESDTNRKDFDTRLSDIKNSYRRAFDSERDLHKNVQETEKSRYAKNVQEIRKDSEEKLNSYQDKMLGAGASLKDQYNRERQQLVRSQEDHMKAVQKDAAQKRIELRDRIDQDIKKTKEVHEAENAQVRQYAQERLESRQKDFSEHSEAMARDYANRTTAMVEAQQRDAKDTNRQHQEKLLDVQRDFNKQLRFIEQQKRRRENGSGEFAEVMEKQNGLSEKVMQENKLNRLRTQLVNAKRDYQVRADADHEAHLETLKIENSNAASRLDKKVNDMNADKISTVAHEREKARKTVENREHQNRMDRAAFEQQLMLEKNNSAERLDKMKENFNKSMKSLEEKHQLALEDVTKTANEDKTDFMMKVQENRSKELFEMKREFGKMMSATVHDYEQRLASYQRENEYLKMTMDQKVSNIIDQTEKKIESQRKMFEERRSADLKAHHQQVDQRENQLRTTMNQMNINFQKKLDKMQVENDTKLKLLTNDYENKLKELRASTSKEVAQKDQSHQAEQQRLKQAFEAEKARIINGYENQISSIKKGHEEQMRSLKDYKQLS